MRLHDNEALWEAVQAADQVVPVFFDEPAMRTAPDTGGLHWYMIHQGLQGLRTTLRSQGAELLVWGRDLPEGFEELYRVLPFDCIYAEEETGTAWSFARDRAVRRWARERRITLREFPHNGVIRRLSTREERMNIWHQRMNLLPRPAPVCPMSPAVRTLASGTPLPEAPEKSDYPAAQRCDEYSAHRVLTSFLAHRSVNYQRGISKPRDSRSTGSRLSVHLAWGTISLRTVVHQLWQREEELRQEVTHTPDPTARTALRAHQRALKAFSSRLFWHDHFAQRLEDEPQMEFHALNPAYEHLMYENDPELLQRWVTGTTGFPLVDAAMRALIHTGFVNFRMRAMLVSFACHVLHLDWRLIRDPMARVMADYLPGIHISQLQMQAGVVGINTIRIYNPGKQLLDHDPDCRFVHRFVPELREQGADHICREAVAQTGSPKRAEAATQMDLFPPEQFTIQYRQRAAVMRDRLWEIRKSSAGRSEGKRVLERHGSRFRRRS